MNKWTHFWDMHSGGDQKLDWAHIYIEAPQDEAEVIFYNRFGRNPNRVTCTCCGEDYSIDESENILLATAFQRNCMWDKQKQQYIEKQNDESWSEDYSPVQEYEKQDSVLFVYQKDIEPEERRGELEDEGYVWKD